MTGFAMAIFVSSICFNVMNGLQVLQEFNDDTNKSYQSRGGIPQATFPFCEVDKGVSDKDDRSTLSKSKTIESSSNKHNMTDMNELSELSVQKKKVNFVQNFGKNDVDNIDNWMEYNTIVNDSNWQLLEDIKGWNPNRKELEKQEISEDELNKRVGEFFLKIWNQMIIVQELLKNVEYNKDINIIDNMKKEIITSIDEFYDNETLSGNDEAFSNLYDTVDAIYGMMRLENKDLHQIYNGEKRCPYTYRFFEKTKAFYKTETKVGINGSPGTATVYNDGYVDFTPIAN